MNGTKKQLVVTFDVTGTLRFLSHMESYVMLQRALIRTELPIAWSEGFNPRPRMTLPLPRTTGLETRLDRLCVLLGPESDVEASAACDILAAQLPVGCVLTEAQIESAPCSWQPVAAEYHVRLVPQTGVQEDVSAVLRRIEAADTWVIDRVTAPGKKSKTLDARPFLEQMRLDGDTLRLTCRITQQGSLKVPELLSIFQLTPDRYEEPIIRFAAQWRCN